MSNRFSNWDEQQKRIEAHQSAQQKSQRISSATAGKKKKRKPENKGKHRKDVNVIKSKETNVKVKTQKDKEGDVNVGITFNRRGNRKGQGRPAGVVGASGRAGSSLASAFGQQQTAQQAQQRGAQTTEAERRQTRQDRLDRQRIEDRERARDRAERTQQREQERRRENARLIIERERLAIERNRPPPVAPAPAHHPDDIGRGFAEINGRIGALDAQVRAGQNIAPPQINVAPVINVTPNINVVGVEAGGIVIQNEGARASANNRGRRANIDRRGGGGHQSFSEESSGDSDIGRPADRRRAERNQRTQPRRPQQRPPAPAPPPAPSETEVGDVSEAESFAVVERGSGTESDEPTIAEIGGEALLGLGGGLARGVGAGATTIGEAVVSGLPSAEDVGGAIGGGIATGAGIAGRAGLAGASAIGGAVVNVVRDAIAPTPAPEPAPEPEPLGLIAQRIAKQKEELRAPTITPGPQPSPLTFNKPAEQATILADIASQAVSGAVAGGRKAINLVSDGLKTVEETVRPHFDYDPLKEGISGRTKRLEEKSEYDLGELSSEGEGAGKIFSGSSGGESDTSYQRIVEGGSAFGSSGSEDELKTGGGTPKPPKPLTAKQRREAIAVGGANELLNQFDDIVKTGGDVLEEAVEKPDSPKPLVSEEILRAKAFGVPKKPPKSQDKPPGDSGDEGEAVGDKMYGDIIRQHATFAPADPTAGGTPKPKRRATSVRPAIRTTSTTKSIDLEPTESSSEEADFFRQSGDLDVSGFGSATESSSSEDVDVSELRKRERAKIRREQIRRGVSKEEAEVLARMGSRFLGDSSSSEGEGRPPEFNERLKSNATEVGNIERALAELDAQKKRNKGMGAIPKSQYDAEELKLINLLRRFRQQQTDLSTATNLPASINLSEADRTSLDNLIRGDDLITTKGGARSGAGRPQTKLFESQTQQQKFEANQNDTAENLRRLNARLKTIKDLPRTQRNRLIGQISTKDRNAILASLTGRLQQASIDSVMATYDAIIENKRLERLYRKDARG
tara:strand:+ start:2528 stop:5602 length:3075 start_codon:yes stop_codon:yes gene_type:complete